MILSTNNLRLLLTLPAMVTDTAGKIWMYSNADWKKYWAKVTASLRITIPTTLVSNDTLEPLVLTDNVVVINGVTYHLASFSDLQAMQHRTSNLETNYLEMRAALKKAGWITMNDGIFDMALGTEDGQGYAQETGEGIALEH